MTRQLSILFLVTIFASCGQTKNEENRTLKNKDHLNGYWILTNYIDKILETNSIAPQRKPRLTWNVIVFKFNNDTLETHGLILKNKFPVSQNIDSLTTIAGMAGIYKLTYNELDKTIIAKDSKNEDTIPYIFRKIAKNEERLVTNIDGKPFYPQMEQNFYEYFIEKIISGTYEPLANYNELKTLKLLTDGTITGFKNYNKYTIHDYFGTLHPFSDDAIMFEDTTKEVSGLGPPDNFEYYKWEFKQDTLILTKYETKDHERFTVGNKQYRLIKQ